MSADELRQAAETLRELADVSLDSPWHSAKGLIEDSNIEERDARWIATMHPGVGLALAEALEAAIELDWCRDDWPEFGNLARLINEVGS